MSDVADITRRDPEKLGLIKNAILLCLNNRLGQTNAEFAKCAAALVYDLIEEEKRK